MKTYWTFIASVLFAACTATSLSTCAFAQSNNTLPSGTAISAGRMSTPSSLRAGTQLVIELSHSANAKKLKPGQKIEATLTQDLLQGGKIVAPVESKLVGHITEATPHTSDSPESRLGFVFDKIELKHHKALVFQAVMQAAAAPAPRRSRVDEPDQMLPPNMMGGSQSAGTPSRGIGSQRSTAAAPTTSSTLAVATTVSSVHVAGTPGNSMGTMTSNTPKPQIASNKPVSAGTGIRGVYGIKGLSMVNSSAGSTPGPVLLSSGSTVKLENGTQFLLVVTGAPVTSEEK